MLKLEPNKYYLTRDGRKAKVYAIYEGQDYPVHGCTFADGRAVVASWNIEGKFMYTEESSSDLVSEYPEYEDFKIDTQSAIEEYVRVLKNTDTIPQNVTIEKVTLEQNRELGWTTYMIHFSDGTTADYEIKLPTPSKH